MAIVDTKLRFTLDTNCIIDWERSEVGDATRVNAPHIRRLVSAWKDGKVELAVSVALASETQKDGMPNPTFADCQNWLGFVRK